MLFIIYSAFLKIVNEKYIARDILKKKRKKKPKIFLGRKGTNLELKTQLMLQFLWIVHFDCSFGILSRLFELSSHLLVH
jgi:hypothetical protein